MVCCEVVVLMASYLPFIPSFGRPYSVRHTVGKRYPGLRRTPVFTGVTNIRGMTKPHFLNARYFNRKVLADA